ncbi:hypothetical protein GCM10029976_051660 [Kribbella albertanoniae]|uniref:Uncharacterized protein n=1 Tax=Kribbella albertanoniae TaxID=1266829 RepID=A0A4R4P149_9ACTN|nr:hypothetical protein [Kribbella albertanoniae]TDC15625.1 hypothetical protein E1261_40215 [Kribbella albertanoniae]
MIDVPTNFREDWERLWALAERTAATMPLGVPFEGGTAAAFGFAGLLLDSPYEPGFVSDYPNGVQNGFRFASTGGDGVHFCAVFGDTVTRVVLSIPLADKPHHIVGESLAEFLALGCRTGYVLDELGYDSRDAMIDELENTRAYDDPERGMLLRTLTDEFHLRPWSGVRERLATLSAQYDADVVWTPYD